MDSTINDMEEVVKTILYRNKELTLRVSALEVEIASLREQLGRYEAPRKDSHNSSIPPSQEPLGAKISRRMRSLRPRGERKSGGQEGHAGFTLQAGEPDAVITHTPDYCTRCGRSLSGVAGREAGVRQSIDIPLPVCSVAINHISMEKTCFGIVLK